MSRSLGYRPAFPRIKRTATEQKLVDTIDNLNAAVKAQQKNQEAKDKAQAPLSFADLVDMSKRDTISAANLDRALMAIYNYGEELVLKATAANELIAQAFKPVVLDNIFLEDTKADALLLFGKPITELTPAMLQCLNRIIYDSQDLIEPMERGEAISGQAGKEKWADMSSIDKVLDKVRSSAPKFGFEFLLLLILIILEEILKLILAPLCEITILGIRIGKMIANAIASGVWLGTAGMVDVRDVCDCKDNPTPECKERYEEGLHASIAKRWDDIMPDFFRGDTPGFPTTDTPPPICDDTNPHRRPNLYETHAALNIIKSFQTMVSRKTAEATTAEQRKANGDYETILAFMNSDAAKHAATSIKLSAGNMQDSLRTSNGSSAVGVNASLKLGGVSPAADFLKNNEFGKNVTKTLNQMLQKIKAVDRWIRATTSLLNFDSRTADMICCFIRIIFNYAIYVAQTETANREKMMNDLKSVLGVNPTAPPTSVFDTLFTEANVRQVQKDFNDVMKQSITDFNGKVNSTLENLRNDPTFRDALKGVLKTLKILEAILSALTSTISADLNFGISVDIKKLREAMLSILGKTMVLAVDTMMTEIRQPTEDFFRQIALDPRWSVALKECDLFSMMTGMLACGMDAMELTMQRMLEMFQRDSDGDWFRINASVSAAYNQKFARILLDIINLILNDFYLLFTICNVDTIYSEVALKQASVQAMNALGLDEKIKFQFENQGYLDTIYRSLGGGVDSVPVGLIGTELADSVFSGPSLGFSFADPLNNTLAPLVKQDFSKLRPAETSDGSHGRKYNTAEAVDPVASIQEQLAAKDCARCKATDFISVPIVDRFNRTAYRGFS